MTITTIGNNGRIEVSNENEITIHYGYLSLRIDKKDFKAFNKMLELGSDHPSHSDLPCALIEMKTGHYIIAYKGLTFALCTSALNNFRLLIKDGIKKYSELFINKKRESLEDINTILFSIEKKILNGDK